MRRLILLFILSVLFISYNSYAQTSGMVGTDIFFAGHWLEIGQQDNGDFGTTTAPAGYNTHVTFGTNLAEVYDYGHDGWAVGAPAYMGDYTFPGSPFEGWEIQVNGARSQAFCNGGAASFNNLGGGTLAGNDTGFVNVGGSLRGYWRGTASVGGGLKIEQETRVDTNASWVVVTSKLYNRTAATISNIYYLRSCDPDNDETWPGGSFTTKNYIDYQNDVDHRVQVYAATNSPTPDLYPLGLCTKDPRAVAFIYDAWPLTFGQDLAAVWSMTYGPAGAGAWYALGTEQTGDIGIGLVYNLGSLCAGDSTFVSYAYTFNGALHGIDSAFPEPTLVVNGVTVVNPPAPAATYDTFNACLYPGLTTIPVDLTSGASGVWTWSTWTWSPGTGLASTTGLTNTINVYSLPPSITYTITGTGYIPTCGTPGPGCTRTIYLTILTCNGATVNSPCLGDPLFFNAPGDSLGATYVWVGPNSWTNTVGTTQSFTMTPSTWADTGTYHVIKTVGGTSDTSFTTVIIHPNPEVVATNNGPLCNDPIPANTLSLTATVTITTATTYSWTGPGGFTSTLPNPTISSFSAADSGIYSVIVTNSFGCKDTGTTDVQVFPPPGVPSVSGPLFYCYGATFVPFTVIPAPGATVYWYPTAAGGAGTTTVPTVNTFAPGTYTFYYGQSIGLCQSPIDSITIVVNSQILPLFAAPPFYHFGCHGDTVIFTNQTSLVPSGTATYTWDFGDFTNSTDVNPTHIYVTQGTYSVVLTATYNGCPESIGAQVVTNHSVTSFFRVPQDTVCFNPATTVFFVDSSYALVATAPGGLGQINSYAWDFGDGNTSTSSLGLVSHSYAAPKIYNVTLTVVDSIGCTSFMQETVVVIGFDITSWHDTSLCLKQPLPLQNKYQEFPPLGLTNFTYLWTGTGVGYLNSDTAHIPYLGNAPYGTYVFLETQSLAGSWGTCFATNTMTVNVEKPAQLQLVTANTTITFGSSIQLNADSELYYWWTPDNGTLNNPNINNPIAKPDTTTTYTVIGMDKYGCTDTVLVKITIDSTMHEFIPTGFTPNGDGLNDYFHPLGLVFQRMVDFRIYNRWGQQVYYSNNYNDKGWDGTFQGVPQDMGTYYYTIIVARPGGVGDDIIYKGDVTLIR